MLKSQYIDKRDFKLANDYIICETSGSTGNKTAPLENFRLIENCSIQIKFLSANTAQTPKLSINGTTAVNIYYEDMPASPTNSWKDGEIVFGLYFSRNETFYWNLYSISNSLNISSISGKDGIEVDTSGEDGKIVFKHKNSSESLEIKNKGIYAITSDKEGHLTSFSNPFDDSKYDGIISLEGNSFDIGGAESGVYKLPNKSFSLFYGKPLSPLVLSEGGLLFIEKEELTEKRTFKFFSFDNFEGEHGEHVCYFGDTSESGKYNKYIFTQSDGKLLINSGEIPSDSDSSFYLSGTVSNTSGSAWSSPHCFVKEKELYSNNSIVANISEEQIFSRKKLTQFSIKKAECTTSALTSEKEVILQNFENIEYTMIDVFFENFPSGSSSLKVKNDESDVTSVAYPIKTNEGNGNFEDIKSGEWSSGNTCRFYRKGTGSSAIWVLEKNLTTGKNYGVTIPLVVDNLFSESTTDALSANQGRELKALISNQVFAKSFDKISDMIDYLNSLDLEASKKLSIGFNLFILELGVPDFWVSKNGLISSEYTYTNDGDFINLFSSVQEVQIGSCKISILEAAKVNLTDYVTLTGTETLTNKTMTDPVIGRIKNGSYYLSVPNLTKNETIALVGDIPSVSGFVDLTTTQTIGGLKTFSEDLTLSKKLFSGSAQILYNADPTFTGSLFLGDGGGSLSHSSGSDGYYNTGLGISVLLDNTTGHDNTACGWSALKYNTTGYNNTAYGLQALESNSSGNFNTASGFNAGRFAKLDYNTTGSNSVFLGAETKANADDETNQIVIGHATTGNGSNTVTIGNSSIIDNYFTGNIHLTGSIKNAANTFTLPNTSGTIALTSDITSALSLIIYEEGD